MKNPCSNITGWEARHCQWTVFLIPCLVSPGKKTQFKRYSNFYMDACVFIMCFSMLFTLKEKPQIKPWSRSASAPHHPMQALPNPSLAVWHDIPHWLVNNHPAVNKTPPLSNWTNQVFFTAHMWHPKSNESMLGTKGEKKEKIPKQIVPEKTFPMIKTNSKSTKLKGPWTFASA